MFGMLPEANVERIFSEGLVFEDDVRWTPQPSNRNWLQFEGFLDSPSDTSLRLNMAVSILREERYRIIVRRGEQILRRLCVRGSHRNPLASSGETWIGKTHKHRWTEQFADKLAYTPPDIATPTFERSEYERVFRAFCKESNIDFRGRWNDPPKATQDRLDI
jgi:hypothetical protein